MIDLAPYAFVDTETNTLPPDHLPWEIAVIWRGSDVDAWMEEVIHIVDFDANTVSDQAAAVNGFYERWMMLGSDGKQRARWMTQRDASIHLERVLAGKRIVGSKPSFDQDTLVNMGCREVWQHHYRDVPSMFLGAYGYDVRGLEGTLDALGIVNEAPHTALGDCRAARDAFVQILTDAVVRA